MMERMPRAIDKKTDMVRKSVEKLERMLYEMSLSEAAGGRPVQSEAVVAEMGDAPAAKTEKD